MWAYVITVANPNLENTVVKAIAKDLPGNKAEMEVTWGILDATL